MKPYILFYLLLAACCYVIPLTAKTQQTAGNLPAYPQKQGLFESDSILEITLNGNTRELLNDRTGDPRNHPLILSYRNSDNSETSLPVNVKTRGHYRRKKSNCSYPPLLIEFPKKAAQPTSLFKGPVKIKLVMPCRGDEYVVREWLVYKLYNLVTPESFRARLVRVKLNDTINNKISSSFYGILLEDEKQLAKRNKSVVLNHKIQPEQAMPEAFLKMAVFEYLVGNTDWSVQYLQNIKLIAADSMAVPVTVPYDFDHAGIVGAPYAKPAEELEMTSCRERRYRGYCTPDMKLFDSTLAFYNRLKKNIYDLYTSCPLIDTKYIKSTTKYLDEFYTIINDPEYFKMEFGYPCNPNGTGNVIIKGLKED